MTTECSCWHCRYSRLASSTTCSSVRLQSLSSVLSKTLYSLESLEDRLSNNHAEDDGHPDKLALHRCHWYYGDATHCWLLWTAWRNLVLVTSVNRSMTSVPYMTIDYISVDWSISLEWEDICRQHKSIFGNVYVAHRRSTSTTQPMQRQSLEEGC